VGGHEHHNWGFTTSGIYRAYFQVSGRRPGQSTNIVSAETPFTFHVLPLKPFEHWTATNWPCECRSNLIAAAANPDSDAGVNAVEYALGLDAKSATISGWPTVSLVTTKGQTYGGLTYTRAKSATDVVYEVMVASSVTTANWQPLTTVHAVVDLGAVERVTMRDTRPLSAGQQRFFKLRVSLR
jgi:surface-anchored protein